MSIAGRRSQTKDKQYSLPNLPKELLSALVRCNKMARMASPDDEINCIQNSLADDTEAFAALVRQHQKMVHVLAFRMTGSLDDAEDLAQETFLRAYRQLGSFRGESKLSTWLCQIAVNLSLNWRARESKIQTYKATPVAKITAATSFVTNVPKKVTNVIAVNRFFPIPWERLVHRENFQRFKYPYVKITAHYWFEGRLLLDFDYRVGIQWRDEKGNVIGSDAVGGSAFAIFNPQTGGWDVVGHPNADFMSRNDFYYRTVLLHGELFTCNSGQIKKYDFSKQQWETLKISDGNNYELFAVNGHLYAANRNIAFEIIDGGKATRILASSRRYPPQSMLDGQDLGTPTLFEGPGHSLRICSSGKIFTWAGKDWHEDTNMIVPASTPEIFTDGILFRNAGFLSAGWQNGVLYRQPDGTYGTLDSQDELFFLANTSKVVSLCVAAAKRSVSSRGLGVSGKATPVPKPVWEMPGNVLPGAPVAPCQSGLYLLEDSFTANTIINDRGQILQRTNAEPNQYNAVLLCFSRGVPVPQKLYLKFSSPHGITPTWMFLATNALIFGSGTPFGKSQLDNVGNQTEAGIWMEPLSEIEGPAATQKQIQLARLTQKQRQAQLAEEKRHKLLEHQYEAMLSKYDLNHNGQIDPDEKEAALADPVFIKFELNQIDTNHNDRLDAQELAWFDANHNGILDPPEEAGIAAAQKLLAQKLIKDFGQNGELDEHEFAAALAQNSAPGLAGQPAWPIFSIYDRNHDRELDVSEVQSYLEQYTLLDVRRKIFQIGPREHVYLLTHPRLTFKNLLEIYWKELDQGD